MNVIRFTGVVVLRRPRTSTAPTPKVVGIGSATIVGAAIRCHRHGVGGRRRRWLVKKLEQLSDEGDPAAALVLGHLTQRPRRMPDE